MKKIGIKWGVILLLVFFLWPAISQGRYIEKDKKKTEKPPSKEEILSAKKGKKKSEYAEGEVLVKFKRGVSLNQVKNITSAYSAVRIAKHFKRLSERKRQVYVLLKSDTLSTKEMVAFLKRDPRVEAVSPNYKRYILQTFPNDPLFGELWGLNNTGQTVNGVSGTPDADIDAPEAWDKNTGSNAVVVADIDTGVDYTHVDLQANMWVNPGEIPGDSIDNDGNGYIDDVYGIDAYNYDSDPMDDNGHGTHTSGTIGAVGNNEIGITGVSWSAKIMALKFLSAEGWGWDADAIECIEYVIDMKLRGVNVVAINASWGGGGYNEILKDAIEAAGGVGIVFCAAAGNEANDNDGMKLYPASYDLPNIISVAATDQADNLAFFSNYGLSTVDIGAPGVNILSTARGLPLVPTSIFFDDMESGSGNWVTGGTNNSWAITEENTYSPTHAWSDSPDGNYLNYTDSWLAINHDIDISWYAGYKGNVGLGFMAWLDLEPWYDYLYVEISKDSGVTWEVLGILTGKINSWNLYGWIIPDTHKTDNFRFRFRLVTDDSVTYDGVYIDDVGIGVIVGSTNYEYWMGTSMATPHVTGAVALMAAQYPTENIYHRINRILSGVDKISSLNKKVSTEGRLNINNSINLTKFNPFIKSVSPTTGIISNTEITIEGIEFGDTKGRVVFYDKDKEIEAHVLSWSNTSIRVRVPSGIPGRYIKVYSNDGKGSNFIDALSSWTFKKQSNLGRDSAAAVAFNGRIYLFGGYIYGGMNCTSAAESYDPKADSWTDIASMPTPRATLTAAEAKGKIYVMGGYNDYSEQTLDVVEAYDPAKNTWETKAPLPLPMSFMKAVSLNGKIYVTGGSSSSYYPLNTLYMYNPQTDSWIQKASMNTARYEHGAVVLNGKIYVFGGVNIDIYGYPVYLSSGEVYDPATNTWSSIADMPIPLARMGATTDGRYIYAIGGTNSLGFWDWWYWWYGGMPVVLCYDPATNTWQDLSNTIYALISPKLASPAVFLPGWGIYSVNGMDYEGWSSDELEYLRVVGARPMPWLHLLLGE